MEILKELKLLTPKGPKNLIFYDKIKIVSVGDSSKRRVNELHIFILGVYKLLIKESGYVSNRTIWNLLQLNVQNIKFAAVRNERIFQIIEDVSHDTISWRNSRNRKLKMSYKTFENLLSKIRSKDYI